MFSVFTYYGILQNSSWIIFFSNWNYLVNWSKFKKGYPFFSIANPDQKTILLKQAYEYIKEICIKYEEDSGASEIEIKTLLRELARFWEKEN